MNFIAIADPEGVELFLDCIRVPRRREIQGEHRALFVRLDTLDFNMAQRRRRQDSASQLEHVPK